MAHGPLGSSGAASVGGGRSKSKGVDGAQADKGKPRSVTPPLLSSATGEDTAPIVMPTPRPNPKLTRGMSSDAVLSSPPRRDQGGAAMASLMSTAPVSLRGGTLAGNITGKVSSSNKERPRRFSLGKAGSFMRHESVPVGGDTKPSSPTRVTDRVTAGRGAEGLAAAASAEAAIALVGTAEPRQRKKDEEGKSDATGHADADVVRALNAAVTSPAATRGGDVEAVDKSAGGSAEVGLESSEESVLDASSVAAERMSTESKGGGEGGSGSCSGDERGGVSDQKNKVVVEDVTIDPRELTFFYSSGHASRPRNDIAARRTVAAARKVWYGVDF